MEPTRSPSESEPGVHSGEDFVHIEEHSKPTGDFSLSDSIVNVEKEDAVEEEEEEEEHKEDSDSVVSVGGGDAAGGDGEGECSSAKVELPEELAKSVVILTCESNGESGSCDVYLIGTAHVSKVFSFGLVLRFLELKTRIELIWRFFDCMLVELKLGLN